MLRLKLALDECKIPQQALVTASGWSKTQISLTLNSGKLPANSAKFSNDVVMFVNHNPPLKKWLEVNGLAMDALLKDVWEEIPDTLPLPLPAPASLPRLLCDIAGRAALLDDDSSVMIIRLARTIDYLHTTLRDLVGEGAPWMARTEAVSVTMLKGERP
ncbi:MAG: hypothetical protein PHC49_10735 [Desulfuromonadaceae bacterium]|nr:hypothetical protein [Desulfuromonadaceae bacterium]